MPRVHELHSTEPFTIDSVEGLPIRGVIQLPAEPHALVVLVHGFKGFREWGFFPWLAERFVASGCGVCRFDFSRNGVGAAGDEFDELDLFEDDTYSTEIADLRSVVEFLLSRQSFSTVPLSLFGHSRGGAVAILGASSVPDLASVVTWSAISDLRRWDEATLREWRARGYMDVPNARTGQMMRVSTAILDDLDRNADTLNVQRAARSLAVPLLVVHGTADETVDPNEARILSESARDSSLLMIDGASHTFGAIHPLVDVPFELDLITRVTTSFIRRF